MYFGHFARCLYVLVFCHVLVPKIIYLYNQNWTIMVDESTQVDVCIGRLLLRVTGHKWTIAQGESAGFGRLCYFHFVVNLVTSFIFITLP